MGIPREKHIPSFAFYTEEGQKNRRRLAEGKLICVRDYLETITTEALCVALQQIDRERLEKDAGRV